MEGCYYFGKCGGCSAQHIPYKQQLDNKKKVLEGITNTKVEVFSSCPYSYRNRMDLIFHQGGLGFREKGKWWKVIDLKNCAIANEKLNQLMQEVLDFFQDPDYFDLKRQTGTLRYAVIRTPTKTSSISFVLNANSTKIAEAVEKIKEFAQQTSAENILVTYVPKKTDMSTSLDYFVVKGTDHLKETFLEKEFEFHAQGFFQNNTSMAGEMQKYINKILKQYDTKKSYLLDLYGGVGTFGIINSDLFSKVTIVEFSKEAIDSAKVNIKNNNITNAEALVLDAKQIKKLQIEPDFIITDPPRSGMHNNTIEYINAIKPKLIIYISCNPQQLKKELPRFKDYTINSAAIFDLFPQTPHSEAIVELKLNNPST